MTNQDSNIPLNIDVRGDPEYRQKTAEALDPGNILLKRFRRHPGAMIGMIVLSILIVASLFAFLSHYPVDQSDMSNRLQSPSITHIMGTDALGRDMLTRVLYGGRISLSVGLIVVGIALAIGVPIGALAGYYGGGNPAHLIRLPHVFLFLSALFVCVLLESLVCHGAFSLL